MLRKKNRIRRNEIEIVFKEGKSLVSHIFTLKFVVNSSFSEPKIAFITPKTTIKQATKRNLLRRRGYMALKNILGEFLPGFMGVFIFRRYEDDPKIIQNEIKNLYNKIFYKTY